MTAYMQFGEGKAVGHWVGRYVWQLRHSGDLLICWKETPDDVPRNVEKGLNPRVQGLLSQASVRQSSTLSLLATDQTETLPRKRVGRRPPSGAGPAGSRSP